MASSEKEISFPKIPVASWWKVRQQFKRTIPTVVTPNSMASLLGVSEASARSNVILGLKKVGLIDEDGKPTSLANDWRTDEGYPRVCQQILNSCYPVELRELFSDRDANLTSVMTWFMNRTRCGETAARILANFYLLLLDANPTAQVAGSVKDGKVGAKLAPKRTEAKKRGSSLTTINNTSSSEAAVPTEIRSSTVVQPERTTRFSDIPQLHINIQLHIAPETSPAQIDQIFESMAKHLRNLAAKD